MFLKIFGKKKDHKSGKKSDDLDRRDCDEHASKEDKAGRSSPIDMPKHFRAHGQTFSRVHGQYSNSRASSQFSVSSGLTESSANSVSSRTLNTSVKSSVNSSRLVYDIDRFKGAKNVPSKMKSMGYQDLWAQAFTFGGR